MTASARKRLLRRTTVTEEFVDDREVDYSPNDYSAEPRTVVTVFSDTTLRAQDFGRRISLHAREGIEPCTTIGTYLRGKLVSRILIHRRNVGPVVKALEVARATNSTELRQDTGSIGLTDGARFVVSGSRHRGRPGVQFQLFAADGTVRGKPKIMFGDEFEALHRACSALLKSMEVSQ